MGLAALFALQVAMVAHAFVLPNIAAAQTAVDAPAADCASMAMGSTSDGDLNGNLCQVHCQAVVQIDATAVVDLIAHVLPPALQVVVARDVLPASAWLAPLAAKSASPPPQLLYARFLV